MDSFSDQSPSENGFFASASNGYHPPSRHSPPPSWLDLRVFYVRVSNCKLDSSTPQHLKLNLIPLSPNTLLEVNRVRADGNGSQDGISTLLRRDRMDKNSEEVTFVSTDSVRVTASMKFEVLNDDLEILLSGILKRNSNGYNEVAGGDLLRGSRKWSLHCEAAKAAAATGSGFPLGRQLNGSSQVVSPMIEVYVAGCFLGNPIVLSKKLWSGLKSKEVWKGGLSSVSGSDAAAGERDNHSLSSQEAGYQRTELVEGEDEIYDYHNEHLDQRTELVEGEDGELSWFNAGVRVGVGIGLSVCLGVGLGIGLAVKTYQGATRSFRRHLR